VAPSLRVNPMPPRITQESHRPRVSDRTMVDIVCTTAQACLVSRSIGVVATRTERATGMNKKPKSTKPVRGLSESSVFHRRQGLEVKQRFFASGRGTNILLDIPLYRTLSGNSFVRLLHAALNSRCAAIKFRINKMIMLTHCRQRSDTNICWAFSLTFRRQKLASPFPIEQVRCRLSIAHCSFEPAPSPRA